MALIANQDAQTDRLALVAAPRAIHTGIRASAKLGRLSGGMALAELTACHPGACSFTIFTD